MVKGQKTLFSKNHDDWSTPKDFYEKLDDEFHFTFDPCPLRSKTDGLSVPWVGNIFINPPYSNIRKFIEKGIAELSAGSSNVCVFLVPARTDTKWFHDLCYGEAEIRFVRGRLKFGNSNNSAPFPSMVLIFKGTK